MTKREAALRALESALKTVAGATVKRNDQLPTAAPAGGLIILRDGDPGEPDVTLSPPTYSWQHQAEVEVIVQKAPTTTRTAMLDDLLAAIGLALAADRTLGGAVDYSEPSAPRPQDIADGGTPIKAALVTVTLYFDTSDPLA
jgi:hypothetical protein